MLPFLSEKGNKLLKASTSTCRNQLCERIYTSTGIMRSACPIRIIIRQVRSRPCWKIELKRPIIYLTGKKSIVFTDAFPFAHARNLSVVLLRRCMIKILVVSAMPRFAPFKQRSHSPVLFALPGIAIRARYIIFCRYFILPGIAIRERTYYLSPVL